MLSVLFELSLLIGVAWAMLAWRVPAFGWLIAGTVYLLSWTIWRDPPRGRLPGSCGLGSFRRLRLIFCRK